MKVICEGLDLSDAVLKVIKAASTKSTNPVLEGIKIKAENNILTLTATDLELAIEKKIKAEVKIEGETVVPGRIFSEFVKKINKDTIEMTLTGSQLKLKYTDSEGIFQCMSAEEFPALKVVDTAQSFSIVKKEFKDLINKIVFSAAVDDSRPILKGILLEIDDVSVNGVAVDGFRLALCTKPIENSTAKMNAVVPGKSLSEIAKLIDDSEDILTLYIQKNYLMADLGGTMIITRLLEGDFFSYKQILSPKDFCTTITINRQQLEDGLERASLLSRGDRNNLVKFDIKDKVLELSSNSEYGNIRENIPVGPNGKDLTIAFNAKYYMDALRALNEEFVKIKFISSASPCIITSVEKEYEYTYLILPVRIV